MDEEHRYGDHWMYRSAINRSDWHIWWRGVHIMWAWVTDDFGNLVHPSFGEHA